MLPTRFGWLLKQYVANQRGKKENTLAGSKLELEGPHAVRQGRVRGSASTVYKDRRCYMNHKVTRLFISSSQVPPFLAKFVHIHIKIRYDLVRLKVGIGANCIHWQPNVWGLTFELALTSTPEVHANESARGAAARWGWRKIARWTVREICLLPKRKLMNKQQLLPSPRSRRGKWERWGDLLVLIQHCFQE